MKILIQNGRVIDPASGFDQPADVAIAAGRIVAIGQAFGLNMIAEGVETEEQMRLLVSMGCRYGQGYAIGRPMPVLEFERWMYQWR